MPTDRRSSVIGRDLGRSVPPAAVPEGQPLGPAAPRRPDRDARRLCLALRRPVGRGSSLLAVLRVDGRHAARRHRRCLGSSHRVRGHGRRARCSDGDGHLFRPLPASLVPRSTAQSNAGCPDRHSDLRLSAAPAGRVGLRSQHRGHDRRCVDGCRPAAFHPLPRQVDQANAPGRRCRPRRWRGPEGVPAGCARGQRAGCAGRAPRRLGAAVGSDLRRSKRPGRAPSRRSTPVASSAGLKGTNACSCCSTSSATSSRPAPP